jgi:hypothetical protein
MKDMKKKKKKTRRLIDDRNHRATGTPSLYVALTRTKPDVGLDAAWRRRGLLS